MSKVIVVFGNAIALMWAIPGLDPKSPATTEAMVVVISLSVLAWAVAVIADKK